MPNQVIMPALGESVVEGTITRWLKAPGDTVEEYESLLEVNTDKVDSEIPSPFAGTLLKILTPEGTVVQAGEVLALIGETGESLGAEAPGADAPVQAVPAQPGPAQDAETEPVLVSAQNNDLAATQVSRVVEEAPPREETNGQQTLGFISPVVGKIASEHNIDLTRVKGTGLSGRITKNDVLAYIEGKQEQPEEAPASPVSAPARTPAAPAPAAPAPASASFPFPAAVEVQPLSKVRRAIADHMVMSKRTSPHVTTIMEANLQRVVAHRETNKAAFVRDNVNLTFTAYFVMATVAALKAYPIVNSSWSEDGIVLHPNLNIGMATSMGPEGLIVPVIKNAAELSLLGLARIINDLANRARLRKLQPDEVKGGTFTITNHGTSGSLFATPIINQPQCGILGVGAIQKRVVVIDDAIAIRPMVYLSLTFDHRILDGAVADYFLGTVVKSLESFQAAGVR